eukprot:2716535-Pleurochrysis_carterae.AAC.1
MGSVTIPDGNCKHAFFCTPFHPFLLMSYAILGAKGRWAYNLNVLLTCTHAYTHTHTMPRSMGFYDMWLNSWTRKPCWFHAVSAG